MFKEIVGKRSRSVCFCQGSNGTLRETEGTFQDKCNDFVVCLNCFHKVKKYLNICTRSLNANYKM